jgi:hypothetical protein
LTALIFHYSSLTALVAAVASAALAEFIARARLADRWHRAAGDPASSLEHTATHRGR